MSKQLIWLSFAITTITAYYQPVNEAKITKTQNKSISFSIFKSISYNSEAYNSTSAQVQVVIEKVNMKGEHKTMWEKTYDAKKISEYPNEENALFGKIEVYNLKNDKEYLEVRYILTYNSKGNELQIQGGDTVHEKIKKIEISI